MTEPSLHKARRLLVYVKDLERAKEFYSGVLGLKLLGGIPEVNFEFETAGPPLVLHKEFKPSLGTGMLSGFVPSFEVESGLHDLIEAYRERGLEIIHEVQEVSHGWIAFVADCEDHVIQLYQGKEK